MWDGIELDAAELPEGHSYQQVIATSYDDEYEVEATLYVAKQRDEGTYDTPPSYNIGFEVCALTNVFDTDSGIVMNDGRKTEEVVKQIVSIV